MPDVPLDEAAAREWRDRAAALVSTNPSEAYEISRQLLNALDRTPDAGDLVRAVVWRCRAEAAAYTGRYKESRTAYASASDHARAARDGGLLGQILVGRIGVLSITGAGREVPKLFAQAEGLLKKAGDRQYLGKLYMNAGNAAYHGEDFQRAFRLYGLAAEVFEETGTRDATWVGLVVNRAVASTQLGHIVRARNIFLDTERECGERGLVALEARVRFNRAFVERIRGDFREALSLLERSGTVFEAQGERAMSAATERARGEIYLELGMGADALAASRASADAFAAEDMVIDENLGRLDEARALLLLDHPVEAAAVLKGLDEFYSSRRTRPRLAIVRLAMAEALSAAGRQGESREIARRALRVSGR